MVVTKDSGRELLTRARGAAILLAAALAPVGILIAGAKSQAGAVALIGIVLFAFQFWVNNVQTLASDFFPNELVASISGLAAGPETVWEIFCYGS